MALTSDEIQSIVSRVLSSLRTNSKTINDLSPVTSLTDSDWFEVAGGKKVAYSVLRDLIASASDATHNELQTIVNKCELLSTHFEASDNAATLILSSKGKTVTCSVPIASASKTGLMSAMDKIKLQGAMTEEEGNQIKSRIGYVEEQVGTKADTYAVQNLEEAVSDIRDDVAENMNNISSLQRGVNTLSTTKADASELAQVSTTATTALNSATVATQSVSAALANSTEAKNAVTALTSRVIALESESVFEELSSEAEWQELYDNGQLIPGMLYYVPES